MRTPTSAPQVDVPEQSLLDVANVITGDGSRWENGIEFTPLYCDPGHVLTGTCPPPTSPDAVECTETIKFDAMVVETLYNWDTRDLAAEPKKMATDALEIGSTRLIERAFWTGETIDPTDPGATATNPDLNPLSGATDLGTAADAVDGLGTVLMALADSTRHLSGSGTVHINSRLGVLLEGHIKDRDGNGLYTVIGGHRVIVGDYPDDMIVGHLGQVDVYLGPVETIEHFDHRTNEVLVQAQRYALAAYNACTAVAVTVDVGS